MKTWKPFADECIYCGCGDAEVLTDSTIDGTAHDGDKARCEACHCPGSVLVEEEDDDGNAAASIVWHDEPGCNCEWCQRHPVDEIVREP